MTVAPTMAIAMYRLPLLRCGTRPDTMPAIGGCRMNISMPKQTAMVAINVSTIASNVRMPRCCSKRMAKTSSTVMMAPQTIGMPKSRFNAIALPITSARSHATIATSASNHSTRLHRRE